MPRIEFNGVKATGIEQHGVVGVMPDGINMSSFIHSDGKTHLLVLALAGFIIIACSSGSLTWFPSGLFMVTLCLFCILGTCIVIMLLGKQLQNINLATDSEDPNCVQIMRKECPSDSSTFLAEAMQRKSAEIMQPPGNTIKLHRIPITKRRVEQKFRHFEVGEPNNDVPHKTILLLGKTGSGKTEFLNLIINFVYGIHYTDDFRFVMVDRNEELQDCGRDQANNAASSCTSFVTAYTLHYQIGFRVPYSLTVVDTPGFRDTRGSEYDEALLEKLKTIMSDTSIFTNSKITSICHVMPISQAKMTQEVEYVITSALQLFGKNTKKNMHVIFTFSDGQKSPALDVMQTDPVLKDLEYPCEINSASLYREKRRFTALAFEESFKSLTGYFHNVGCIESTDLSLTMDNLNTRAELRQMLGEISANIQRCLDKQGQIYELVEGGKELNKDIKSRKDFLLTRIVQKTERIGAEHLVTNCKNCKMTCHDPCDDQCASTGHCSMLQRNKCTICKEKCSSSYHCREKFKYVLNNFKEKITFSELCESYKSLVKDRNGRKGVLKVLVEEYQKIEYDVLKKTVLATELVSHINSISLRQSTPESELKYIDQLILTEEASSDGLELKELKLIKLRNLKKAVYKIMEYKRLVGDDPQLVARENLESEINMIMEEAMGAFAGDNDVKDILKGAQNNMKFYFKEMKESWFQRFIGEMEKLWKKCNPYDFFVRMWSKLKESYLKVSR